MYLYIYILYMYIYITYIYIIYIYIYIYTNLAPSNLAPPSSRNGVEETMMTFRC